jgi:prepilin-type N-terminal cleavage/methylation domain-containing protein
MSIFRTDTTPQRAHRRSGSGSDEAGFTLVEMIVAVGLFSVVMVVSITTLLSLIDANRKAQALQSVMNNLNIALDGMVRSIREGSNYRCGGANPGDPDCAETPGTILYFKPNCPGSCPDWIYDFHDGRLWRSVDGTVGGEMPLTAPEVTIDSVSMYVIGATRGDSVQPKVVIIVRGSAGYMRAKIRTNFHIQSTAVQRVLDI